MQRPKDQTPDLSLPFIHVVTPTYSRLVQKAELTRLSQTLRLVPNIHWTVIEDSEQKTKLVTNFLMQCQVSYTHLNVFKPSVPYHERGVQQRNAGLKWIRENVEADGVIYFADDDNTYDVRIFEEVRPFGSSPQFENRIIAWVYIRSLRRSTKSSILLAGTGVWKNSSVCNLVSC